MIIVQALQGQREDFWPGRHRTLEPRCRYLAYPIHLTAGHAALVWRDCRKMTAEPLDWSMCNLYSITTNQAAIIALFRVLNRYIGNLPPMTGVFPDYPAPIVRNAGSEREMV